MTQRFKNATDALYEGFFNGTLAKGSCVACACGNIVAKAAGIKLIPNVFDYNFVIDHNYPGFPNWWDDRSPLTIINTYNFKYAPSLRAKNMVLELTGYNAAEMAAIETAFEGNTFYDYEGYNLLTEQDILEDQYKGLVAVFDVLMELDGIQQPEYKAKLNTHPKLKKHEKEPNLS